MKHLSAGRVAGLVSLSVMVSAATAQSSTADPSTMHRKVTDQGISVDFSVEAAAPAAQLREGDPVLFRFNLADSASGSPILGAHPAAWLDHVAPGEKRSSEVCEQKFRTFLGGGLAGIPDLNLNIYYAVTLNSDNTLSVLDPLVGFGGSKLLAIVQLRSPGFDWVLTADQSKLFVSLPDANQVAMVDTKSWTVVSSADVTLHPRRVVLQPDQQYLWVASDPSGPDGGDSGVSVFSVNGLRLAARIVTGRGSHEIVFSEDSRYALVSNSAQDTVSIIDTRTLRKVKDLETGSNPVSMDYSAKVGAALVSHRSDGTVAVVSPQRGEVLARIPTAPGVGQIRFDPSRRYAFAVNSGKNEVYIIDAALQRLVQTFDVKSQPDQISFTDTLAYIRHSGSEQVIMVPLDQIGAPGKAVPVVTFPGGKHPPGDGATSPAAGIVPASGDSAVLVANPKDRSVYYYGEGMAAPVGTFDVGGHQPQAVIVVDRSLRSRPGSGSYETTGIVGAPGVYDVVFFLDSPKLVHCFAIAVAPNPDLEAKRGPRFNVRYASPERTMAAGESHRIEFRLTNDSGLPVPDSAKGLSVLAFQVPGIWRDRVPVQAGADGSFIATFTPPRPGIYYVNVESTAAKLNPSAALVLRAVSK